MNRFDINIDNNPVYLPFDFPPRHCPDDLKNI